MVFYGVITLLIIFLAIWYQKIREKDLVGVKNQYHSDFLSRMTQEEWLEKLILVTMFSILFIVSFLRYYVGNDYSEYLEIFQKIYGNQVVSTEIGFNGIVQFFQMFLGQYTFIPIFGTIAFITIFFMGKSILDQSEWFSFGVFLFLANGYYLSSLNTVRYYCAFAIAIFAAKYAIQKKWMPFLLWILAAATIHKTVLIVIPIFWFATRKWKTREIIIVLLFCVTLLFFRDFYREIIFKIYPYYENSAFDTGETSLFNIIKCFAILLFCIPFYQKVIAKNAALNFYYYLNLGALLLYCLCSFIPEVSRIGYYLVWSHVMLIPNLLKRIEHMWLRRLLVCGVILAYFLYFLLFLRRAGSGNLQIIPYQTWIAAPIVW